MPRPPARYVERKLWVNFLRRTGRLLCNVCLRTRVEADADPKVTKMQGALYEQYLKAREKAGIVSTPLGWRYKDEVTDTQQGIVTLRQPRPKSKSKSKSKSEPESKSVEE